MAKYLDSNGLSHFMTLLKTRFNDKVDKENGKGLSTNDYTTTEKNKLAGIAAGAEVNQNAFSNVKVGATTVQSDSKTDTLELIAGTNITLTPDATNDTVTISAASGTDTQNTAGSNQDTAKLYLVGAKSQTTGTNGVQTYSNSDLYATNGHLYALSLNLVRLETTSAGFAINNWFDTSSGKADLVVGASGIDIRYFGSSSTPITSLSVPSGENYTLDDACAKGVDTTLTSGTTSTALPTSQAVADYVDSAVAIASSGALTYKGVATALTDITSTNYKQGWYWMVGTNPSITIDGVTCEPGDMIIAKQDKTATADNDLDVIQTNIEALTTVEIDTLWAAA